MTVPYYCTLTRGADGKFGLNLFLSGKIMSVVKDSSADVNGLKKLEQIFSINKRNVLGEDGVFMENMLKASHSSVEIGVLRPDEYMAGIPTHRKIKPFLKNIKKNKTT